MILDALEYLRAFQSNSRQPGYKSNFPDVFNIRGRKSTHICNFTFSLRVLNEVKTRSSNWDLPKKIQCD
jgi:hypothetical protein